MAVLLGVALLMLALVLPAVHASAADGNVCPPGDSGKIDVPGDKLLGHRQRAGRLPDQ